MRIIKNTISESLTEASISQINDRFYIDLEYDYETIGQSGHISIPGIYIPIKRDRIPDIEIATLYSTMPAAIMSINERELETMGTWRKDMVRFNNECCLQIDSTILGKPYEVIVTRRDRVKMTQKDIEKALGYEIEIV